MSSTDAGLEALVKKATDSMLLDADYAAIMQIVDLAASSPSKTIPTLLTVLKNQIQPPPLTATLAHLWSTSPYSSRTPKETAADLRDTAIRSLLVIEALLKNTKSPQLITSFGSKDFLGFLRKKATDKKCELQVSQKILTMMQSWANAFSTSQLDSSGAQSKYYDFSSADSPVAFVHIVRQMRDERMSFPMPISGDSEAYMGAVEAMKKWIAAGGNKEYVGFGSPSTFRPDAKVKKPGEDASWRDHSAYPKRQVKVRKIREDIDAGRSSNEVLADIINAYTNSGRTISDKSIGRELSANLKELMERFRRAVEDGELLRKEEGNVLEEVLNLIDNIACSVAAWEIVERGGVPPEVKVKELVVKKEDKVGKTKGSDDKKASGSPNVFAPSSLGKKEAKGSAIPTTSSSKGKQKKLDDDEDVEDEFAALARRPVSQPGTPSMGNYAMSPTSNLLGSPIFSNNGSNLPSSAALPIFAAPTSSHSSPFVNPVPNSVFATSPTVSSPFTTTTTGTASPIPAMYSGSSNTTSFGSPVFSAPIGINSGFTSAAQTSSPSVSSPAGIPMSSLGNPFLSSSPSGLSSSPSFAVASPGIGGTSSPSFFAPLPSATGTASMGWGGMGTGSPSVGVSSPSTVPFVGSPVTFTRPVVGGGTVQNSGSLLD